MASKIIILVVIIFAIFAMSKYEPSMYDSSVGKGVDWAQSAWNGELSDDEIVESQNQDVVNVDGSVSTKPSGYDYGLIVDYVEHACISDSQCKIFSSTALCAADGRCYQE